MPFQRQFSLKRLAVFLQVQSRRHYKYEQTCLWRGIENKKYRVSIYTAGQLLWKWRLSYLHWLLVKWSHTANFFLIDFQGLSHNIQRAETIRKFPRKFQKCCEHFRFPVLGGVSPNKTLPLVTLISLLKSEIKEEVLSAARDKLVRRRDQQWVAVVSTHKRESWQVYNWISIVYSIFALTGG